MGVFILDILCLAFVIFSLTFSLRCLKKFSCFGICNKNFFIFFRGEL